MREKVKMKPDTPPSPASVPHSAFPPSWDSRIPPIRGQAHSAFLPVFPILLLFAVTITLHLLLPRHAVPSLSFEPPLLLPILNVVFLFAASGVVAYVAMVSYLSGGSLTVLLLGCGVLTLGTGSLVAGWLGSYAGPNANITVFTVSALFASILHVGGSMSGLRQRPPKSGPSARGRNLAEAYLGVFVLVGLLSWATIAGTLPPFVQNRMPTTARFATQACALILFALSSFLIMLRFGRNKSRFLYWYGLALALLALTMLSFLFGRMAADPIIWTGRCARYVAGIYFIIALASANREARERGVDLGRALSDLFSAPKVYWQDILASVSDAVISCDDKERILQWNKAAEDIFGYSFAEAVGQDLKLVFPEGRADELISGHAHEPGVTEANLKRKGGSSFVGEVSLSAAKLAIGDVVTLVVRDVTERKKTEEALKELNESLEQRVAERTAALQESEARFRLALRNAPVSVAVQDRDLKYVWAYNQRTAKPEEIVGKLDDDIFTAEEVARLRPLKQRVIREGVEIREQMWFNRPDGRIFLDLYWEPIRDEAGQVIGVGSATVDLTPIKIAEESLNQSLADFEAANANLRASRVAALNLMEDADIARKKAEEAMEALRTSERRLVGVLESMPDAFVSFDADMRYTYVNANAERLQAASREELLGKDVRVVYPDQESRKTISQYEQVLRDQEPVTLTSYHAGFDRWLETRAFPTPDGVSVFYKDVSAQVRAEEALQKAHNVLKLEMEERTRQLHEKEVLLKEVHHRVKNNLQVISSLVSLQADGSKNETVREVLRDVTYRVRSMALVHEKLYQSADLAHINFAEYSRSLLSYLWRAHGAEKFIVNLLLDLEPVLLPVDIAVPCGLILNELAGNALKHAFKGRTEGEVTVSLRSLPDSRISLAVRDNGIGLPEGLDWRQARSLGLRLVQMLAGQLGGTVEASDGKGTMFEVVFGKQTEGGGTG